MKIVIRFFSVLILSSLLQLGYAQQTVSIDSMINIYALASPKEKIHIHFDRQQYNPGDTVWYKVYLLAANVLSPISRNMYVEWYDSTGTLIKQTVAPLYQSTAKGSFEIPASYKGSMLHLKAFTRWMLNDEADFIYQKNIAIYQKNVFTKKLPDITRVEIFPEGGALVKAATSRVAFKATNKSGLPIKIKGFVVNSKNEVVDTLKVQHDGMGIFNLTPFDGEEYRLNWTDEFGVKGTTPINGIAKEGAVLTVKTTNEKAMLQIERSANAGDAFKQMTLLIHMNQEVMYKVAIKMSERTLQKAEIPIDELPTGVLQFSLFTSNWVPVAERIVFVNNHTHDFNTKLNPIYVSIEKRAKNSLEIFVSDTAMTNMSVSVTDATAVIADQYTIFSDFLLSDELRGYVHNPAYYFKSDADSITAKLDLVLMTNGWRKFNWEKIKAGIAPEIKYYPETDYMSLTGKVFGGKNINFGNQQLNFVLVAKDSSKNILYAPIHSDGSFEQPGLFFYDTVKVYYNFNGQTKLNEAVQVKIDNGLLRKENDTKILLPVNPSGWAGIDSVALARLNYFLVEQERIRKSMETATLAEVTVKAKPKNPLVELDKAYSSGLFSGGDGYTFDLTNGSNAAMDILTYLQGKVAGLQISGAGSQASLSWRGGTPDLYLNEMRSDINMVAGISIADVAMIKVFRPPFFGSGGGGAGGAVAIYTKKGGDTNKGGTNSKGMESTMLGGYSRFKEFYNPVYEKGSSSYDLDSRYTLYWNPYIITNKKSPRYRIEFYNNDVSKKYQVVIEGINAEGKMTRVVRLVE